MPQDGKIPVGFHCEADGVRNFAQAAIEFLVRSRKSCAAINVSRRSKGGRGAGEVHSFAEHVLNALGVRGFLPGELRREFRRVDKFQVLTGPRRLRAHRTFSTTSVRSSASGALCANQSTSRKSKSANSVALSSCCCSMSRRSFSVPKNCPSLLLVSASPSEGKTIIFPGSSVTPHSS